MIAENLADIMTRILAAAVRAGRKPEEVRVVAAAKGQSPEKITEAVAAGVRVIGENYVQEAARVAHPGLAAEVEYHMIGHLQSNKAGKAVELFHVIETVDNERIAEALERRASALGKTVGVLIQVNLSGEHQKSGADESRAAELARVIRAMPHLALKGLMTMPPFFDEPEPARPYFRRIRELRDRLTAAGAMTDQMNELSMGMSGDFEVAVEEGATLVRIGTALFGPRPGY
jgi:hypothetical protein